MCRNVLEWEHTMHTNSYKYHMSGNHRLRLDMNDIQRRVRCKGDVVFDAVYSQMTGKWNIMTRHIDMQCCQSRIICS